jgi:hypothetical protein
VKAPEVVDRSLIDRVLDDSRKSTRLPGAAEYLARLRCLFDNCERGEK